MNEKPKVGLFFLVGDSWWGAGVSDAKEGRFAGFLGKVEDDASSVTGELEKHFDIVSSGLLHTREEAVIEARKFNTEGVDAVIFCPIIWTNDPPVVAFIQEMKRVPLIMWAYDPFTGFPDYLKVEMWLRGSGPVSVQQSSNIFKRYNWDFEVVFGNEKEEETIRDIKAFVRASAVKKGLVGTRIGVLPGPCRVVVSTWIDEFFLLEKLLIGFMITVMVGAFDSCYSF